MKKAKKTLQANQTKKPDQGITHLLSLWLLSIRTELLKDAWQYLRGSSQKHTCLDGVKQARLRQAQTEGLPQNGCKWVQFVALTAISLECIWSLHHKCSSSTHQISFTGCETHVRIVHLCSFSQCLRGREGTSTNRRAINCEEKRSDRWTDGFSILLFLPVHPLLTMKGEELRKKVRGNDLCRCIRLNCSFTWTYKWGPMVGEES